MNSTIRVKIVDEDKVGYWPATDPRYGGFLCAWSFVLNRSVIIGELPKNWAMVAAVMPDE